MLQTQAQPKAAPSRKPPLPSGSNFREPVSHHGLSTEAVPRKCVWASLAGQQGVNEGPRQEVTCPGLSRTILAPPVRPCLSGSQAKARYLSSKLRPWGPGLGRDREPCCPDVALPAFAGGCTGQGAVSRATRIGTPQAWRWLRTAPGRPIPPTGTRQVPKARRGLRSVGQVQWEGQTHPASPHLHPLCSTGHRGAARPLGSRGAPQ